MTRLDADRCTAGQICDLFGVSDHVLREWLEDGCPVVRRGERGQSHVFNATEVHRWAVAREVEAARQPDSAAAELSRLRRSQRQLLDVQAAQRRARLIPSDDCRRAWAAIRATFRERMARVLTDAAAKGWPPHVLDELEAGAAEALAELAGDPLRKSGDDTEIPE